MNHIKNYPISLSEAIQAKHVVYHHLKPTQLIYYEGLSKALNANIFVKHENHNPGGSFKIRGGVNLMHHLKNQSVPGVITFSTGNHGLSIAKAAKWFGIKATVVVPLDNNPVKNRRIKESGADLVEHGHTFEQASLLVEQLCQDYKYYYVHPADEPHLINGVATEFLEIYEDLPKIDAIIVPIGAGSEAAAATTVFKTLNKKIDIFAVQAQASQAAYQSWKNKKILTGENTTFAGGFATGKAYQTTFDIYSNQLTDFILLSEQEIYQSIAMGFYFTQNIAEGAGSAALMAAHKIKKRIQGKNVVLQMSGGNASFEEIKKALNDPITINGL